MTEILAVRDPLAQRACNLRLQLNDRDQLPLLFHRLVHFLKRILGWCSLEFFFLLSLFKHFTLFLLIVKVGLLFLNLLCKGKEIVAETAIKLLLLTVDVLYRCFQVFHAVIFIFDLIII